MILRDISVFADNSVGERFKGGFVQRFHRETCCVADLFSGLLQSSRFNGGALAKVSLTLHDSSMASSLSGDRVLLNVLVVHGLFEFDRYQNLDNGGKKTAIASAIAGHLRRLAPLHGWDGHALDHTISKVQAHLPDIRGESPQRVGSACGRYAAGIDWQYDVDGVDLAAVLWKRGARTPLCRKPLGRVVPSIGCLASVLKHARWLGPDTFGLQTPDFSRKPLFASFVDEMAAA